MYVCLYFSSTVTYCKSPAGTNTFDLNISSQTEANLMYMYLVGQQILLDSKSPAGTNTFDLNISSPTYINFVACKSNLFYLSTCIIYRHLLCVSTDNHTVHVCNHGELQVLCICRLHININRWLNLYSTDIDNDLVRRDK